MILSKITPPWRGKPLFFEPPFPYLAWVIWGIIVWCYLLHPSSAILQGYLPDTDDYMYLNQTLDWLKGQSWFDNTQYRLNPPEGIPSHFTRLNQLHLAAIILPLHHGLGLDWQVAATLAAVIVPIVLLIILLKSLAWVAGNFVPLAWRGAACFVGLFAGMLMFQYTPGRVDHTGLVVILTVLSFGCVLRLMQEPERKRWPLLAGSLLALALAVALESLPWILLFSAWVGFWLLKEGRPMARAGLLFGLALYLTSVVALVALRPVTTWFEPELLRYSSVYVLLAGIIATACAAGALVAPLRSLPLRLAIGIAVAVGLSAVFLLQFPQLAMGPYGDIQPRLGQLMLNNINEAFPLNNDVTSIGELLAALALPLLGLIAVQAMWESSRGRQKWQWFFLLLVLLIATFLTVLYQKRFLTYAQLFSVFALTALLYHGLQYVRRVLKGRKQFSAEAGLIALVGVFPGVLLPAMFDNRSFYPSVLLFPVQFTEQNARTCNMDVLADILRLPMYYGDRPRRIMNMLNEGPELLFRTPHMVYAAPYHTNVGGNLTALDFFTAQDAKTSERIARDNKIDLIVMCKSMPGLYLGSKERNVVVDDAAGEIAANPHPTFAEQLKNDKLPDWVKKPNLPLLRNYLVFEVLPAKTAANSITPPAASMIDQP